MLNQIISSKSDLILENTGSIDWWLLVGVALGIVCIFIAALGIPYFKNENKKRNKILSILAVIVYAAGLVTAITITIATANIKNTIYDKNASTTQEWAQTNYDVTLTKDEARKLSFSKTELIRIDGAVVEVSLRNLEGEYYLLVNGVELNQGFQS